jgi:hypothetical protein
MPEFSWKSLVFSIKEAASLAVWTQYGDWNPLLLEKKAGNALSFPKVATHTP